MNLPENRGAWKFGPPANWHKWSSPLVAVNRTLKPALATANLSFDDVATIDAWHIDGFRDSPEGYGGCDLHAIGQMTDGKWFAVTATDITKVNVGATRETAVAGLDENARTLLAAG